MTLAARTAPSHWRDRPAGKWRGIKMRVAAAAASAALILWSAALAYLVAQQAFTGSRYVQWSADPVVLWGELALAACSGLIAVAATVFAYRKLWDEPVRTMEWIGFGFLAVGAIGIASGWLGLRVPTTPGYDVLSRGEPLVIIGGAIALAVGFLVVLVSGVASWWADAGD